MAGRQLAEVSNLALYVNLFVLYLLHIVDESAYKFCILGFGEEQAFIYWFVLLCLSEFLAAVRTNSFFFRSCFLNSDLNFSLFHV